MSLITEINADFLSARKAKEKEKSNMLGVVKGAIQNKGGEATDELVMEILKSTRKGLNQSIEKGDTPTIEKSKRELLYIEKYFPQLMSEDEVITIVSEMVNGGVNNVGQVMGAFNKTHKGLADNNVVKKVAEELLS